MPTSKQSCQTQAAENHGRQSNTLMVALLLLLILTLLGGTLLFSRGAEVALEYVYHSPLFTVLLGMLALRMLLELVGKKTRRRRIGVRLCHLAVVIIIVGGGITRITREEGVIILEPGQASRTLVKAGEGRSLITRPLGFTLALKKITSAYGAENGQQPQADGTACHIVVIESETEHAVRANHPFRHEGWTIYQQGISRDNPGAAPYAVLKAVSDPGRNIVWAGYALLALGLLLNLRRRP